MSLHPDIQHVMDRIGAPTNPAEAAIVAQLTQLGIEYGRHVANGTLALEEVAQGKPTSYATWRLCTGELIRILGQANAFATAVGIYRTQGEL